MKAATLENGGKTYDVIIRGEIDKLDDLMNLQIKSSTTGGKVPSQTICYCFTG